MTAIIHCDGSCDRKNGEGGYGTVVEFNEFKYTLSEAYENTTNNRMELRAAIAGLAKVPTGMPCKIVSDSRYVVNGINLYLKRWKANNWQAPVWEQVETGDSTKKWKAGEETKEISNRDLWEVCAELIEKRPTTAQWIKGHKGHKLNELCDTLAGKARKYGKKLQCRARPTIQKETPEF